MNRLDPNPVMIVLIDPTWDDLHEGFVLRSALQNDHLPCVVRIFGGDETPSAIVRALLEVGRGVAFFTVRERTLELVLTVAGRFRRSAAAIDQQPADSSLAARSFLLGRELADQDLRAQVPEHLVSGMLVGETYTIARQLFHAWQGGEPLPEIAGVVVPPRRLIPRALSRGLDLAPRADFKGHPQLVARALPLRTSRGYPHPCLFLAERAWEAPVARQTTARILEDLSWYSRELKARTFIFTDLALNTDGGALLQLAEGILGLDREIHWHARLWADPELDHAALHLLRRCGCVGLDLLVFSASDELHERLETGVRIGAVDAILEAGCKAGIPVRVDLRWGLPTESDQDRLATLAWLSRQSPKIYALSGVEPCVLRSGAPLRRSVNHGSGSWPGHDWHDGGSNNPSSRATWVREARCWIEQQGIWVAEGKAHGFPADLKKNVLSRITRQVDQLRTQDDRWKRDHRVWAGILQGDQAYQGPEILYLDLPMMRGEDAINILEQLAQLGTRRLILGTVSGTSSAASSGTLPATSSGEWLSTWGPRNLKMLLQRALDLGVQVELHWSGGEHDLPLLHEVDSLLGELVISVTSTRQGDRLDRTMNLLRRAPEELAHHPPLIALELWPGFAGGELGGLIAVAQDLGVDRLTLRMQGQDEWRTLNQPLRDRAIAALREVQTRGELDVDRLGSERLLLPSNRPPGFALNRSPEGWVCCCPAGRWAKGVLRNNSDLSALFAEMEEASCRECPRLADCPVDRMVYRVRLPLLILERPLQSLALLEDEDGGLGWAARWIETHPCVVGWSAARVDAAGDLYLCPHNAHQSVGNVLAQGAARVWYSIPANTFRRLGLAGSRAMPFVDRQKCARRCLQMEENRRLIQQVEGLRGPLREALEDQLELVQDRGQS